MDETDDSNMPNTSHNNMAHVIRNINDDDVQKAQDNITNMLGMLAGTIDPDVNNTLKDMIGSICYNLKQQVGENETGELSLNFNTLMDVAKKTSDEISRNDNIDKNIKHISQHIKGRFGNILIPNIAEFRNLSNIAENGNLSNIAEDGNQSIIAENGNLSNIAEDGNQSIIAENGNLSNIAGDESLEKLNEPVD